MDNLNNNFNIADMQAQIYGLPYDVQGYMLSFVNGFDFETLKSVNLVSKLWHNTIQTLSRQLVDRYFPYLKTTKPKAYANNPLKLLSDECKYYQKELTFTHLEGKMSLALAALSGNRDAIEAEENQKTKIEAYSLFFANGHTCSLEGFNKEEKNRIMKLALEHAALNGHLLVVQHFLNTILNTILVDIYPYSKGQALQRAAHNGHLSVVQYLLHTVRTDICAYSKGFSLEHAAQNGHLHVIQAINSHSLRMAAVQGDIAEIQYLLKKQKPGQEISSEDKGLALIMAAQYGHLNIVEELLQQSGKEISLEYKKGALDVLENTDDNNNAQKTNLITLLQMHTLTEQMIADFTPAPMFTPNYQAVGENDLSLKRKHDGSEEGNRDAKKRKENLKNDM